MVTTFVIFSGYDCFQIILCPYIVSFYNYISILHALCSVNVEFDKYCNKNGTGLIAILGEI